MGSWSTFASALAASFLASMVEVVEAFTIVLAVGVTKGWRPALTGAAAAAVVLAATVALFGPALALAPVGPLRVAVGLFLLAFGGRWLRKAILRAAGRIPMRDEDEAYARETQELASAGADGRLAAVASFKAVFVEGFEVVLIVLAVGAGRGLVLAASIGALAAAALVLAAGFALRHPLSRVPENALKFAVGMLLVSFGLFWLGEGAGIAWPGGDAAILALLGAVAATAFVLVRALRINPARA
ncbi:MAG: hypothetical protein KGI57_01220 [Hyphomicrobiales bacterium]|nr:hypothetical protein [Hyphomicrobiales bacterium]